MLSIIWVSNKHLSLIFILLAGIKNKLKLIQSTFFNYYCLFFIILKENHIDVAMLSIWYKKQNVFVF